MFGRAILIPTVLTIILLANGRPTKAAAKQEVFKNCAQTSFCTRLRKTVPVEKAMFRPVLDDADVSGSITTVPINNINRQNLTLTITALKGEQYRVTLEEPDSHRYNLENVLASDDLAATPGLSITEIDDDSMTVRQGNNNYFTVRALSPGFSVEFYHNDVLQASLDGKRIVFEKATVSEAFSFAYTFYNSDFLLGLAEHAQGIPLLHTADGSHDPYRLHNCDVGYYTINSTKAMYGSVPVIYSHGNFSSGVFLHNAAQEWIEINSTHINKTAYFMVESGVLDLFVLMGPTISDTVKQYTNLTGTYNLPPQWALGFHESRYSFTEKTVKSVITAFDAGNFSLDAVWLGYNWTNAGRYFEWEPTDFNDPIDLMDYMARRSLKLGLLNDPHVKVDKDYDFYEQALKENVFVEDSSGTKPYTDKSLPGNSNWLDFLNPAATTLYSSYFSNEHLNGTETLAGIWNDMNEPSIDDTNTEKTMSSNLIHYNNVSHKNIHNVYGHTHVMATYKGLLDRNNATQRPFVLTRSHFSGTQRYAALWMGDNTADWSYLRISWPMCLTYSLIGLPFCGADIGGFKGQPDDDLNIRWYQVGSWLPLMMIHSTIHSLSREPYTWSNATQDHLREAIQFRYKHLPVWYTQFYHHSITGEPVVRPLFYNYPQDKNTFDVDDEIMLGNSILARSIYESNVTSVKVYFPGSEDYWYQITGSSQKVFRGNSTQNLPVDISFIPVFYKAGSIIPRKEVLRKTSSLMHQDPHTMYVMLNQTKMAEGDLYVDDYMSFEYKNDNHYAYMHFIYNGTSEELSFSAMDPNQNTKGIQLKISSVIVHAMSDDTENTYTIRNLEHTSENVPLAEIDFTSDSIITLQ